MSPRALSNYMTVITSFPHSPAISFTEFRDYLLLLPRKVSPREIHPCCDTKKFMGDNERGVARFTLKGVFFAGPHRDD